MAIEVYKQLQKKTSIEAEAISSLKRDINSIGDVCIGTDVEFLWMNWNSEKKGSPVFYPADNVFIKNGVFGTDGRSIISEMRFRPAVDVRAFNLVIENGFALCKTFVRLKLQRLAENQTIEPYGMGAYSLIESYRMNLPESIGLHIHFGFSNKISEIKINNAIAALDVFLHPIAKIFEPPLGHFIRTQSGFYGDFSDYRLKPYGFEYRALPSCVENRQIFIGIFALAKAIVYEVYKGRIDKRTLAQFRVKKGKVYSRNYLKVLAKQTHLFAKKYLRFYYVYRKEIDTLIELALSKNPQDLFCTHKSVFESWGINPITNLTKTQELATGFLVPCSVPLEGYVGLPELNTNGVAFNITEQTLNESTVYKSLRM